MYNKTPTYYIGTVFVLQLINPGTIKISEILDFLNA